jgi:hypothetical protein
LTFISFWSVILWQFHEEGAIRRLRALAESECEVYLAGLPSMSSSKNKSCSNSWPTYKWAVGYPLILLEISTTTPSTLELV